MEDNKQENPQKPVVVYGVVNIGCDQTGATFQTLVSAPEREEKKEKNDVNVNENLDKIEEAHAEVPKNDADLIERLKPIFYNNEEDVKLFLKEISGMKPGDITDLVNRWTKDKRISDYGYSRKGVLWEILNEAGLYTKSRQNWNRRVD